MIKRPLPRLTPEVMQDIRESVAHPFFDPVREPTDGDEYEGVLKWWAQQLVDEVDRLRAALEAVEWHATYASPHDTCPTCTYGKSDGHDSGCVIAEALGRLPGHPSDRRE